MGEAYIGNPAINIPEDVIAKGEYIQDAGDALEKYNTIWTEFTK
jgi:hypothetical protein